jgi:predicted nucleotidyltransferase
MNNFGLPKDVFSDIIRILSRYPEIKSAKIFGSRAKGNYKRYSDVDIAVYAHVDYDLSPAIMDALEDLDTIYNFDVIHYEKVSNAEIKAHIDRVGVEILSDKEKENVLI